MVPRMTYRSRAAAISLAALCLVAGGCGSDTKSSNDYVSAINKVQTDFANNVRKVGSTPAGSDPAKAAKDTFTQLQAAIDKVVADLKGVQPPDKVKTLHSQLIGEMTQFDNDVKAAGDSLNSKDPKAIVAAQSKFASSASSLGTRISQTISAINQKLKG
jgi:hypothetical protein